MKRLPIILCFVVFVCGACDKPMSDAQVAESVDYYARDYAASANDIYYATRWALEENGYPVASENLADGIVTTAWLPTSSDSHYMDFFGRPDYGVTNSYHRLEVEIVPGEGRTEVKISSRPKTLVMNFKSSGKEEKKVLDRIGNYLRKKEPSLTNIGIEE